MSTKKLEADLGGVVNWTGGDIELVLDYVPQRVNRSLGRGGWCS